MLSVLQVWAKDTCRPIGYKDMNNSSDSNSFSMYLCMFFTLLLKACDLTNRHFILLLSMIFKITKTFVKSGTSYEKYSYLCTANLTDTPMKQRPHIGSCQHSTHTSVQHKNAAKAQMIKSQTSERKNTQKSFIFHFFFCACSSTFPPALKTTTTISRIP